MDPKTREELHELLSSLLDGTLGGKGQDRLGGLLRQQAAARDLYLAYCDLHADLTLRSDAVGLRSAESGLRLERALRPLPAVKTAAPVARRRVQFALGLSSLAAGLLLAALLLWPRVEKVSPRPSELAAEPTDNSIAVLLQAPGAEWGETDLPTRAGAPLAPGWLRLKAGFAHLEFYCGATVILEGPADFRLISRTEAYCQRGKLRATVPPHAEGFTIGSPKLDLVDLGTEFGMRVDSADKAEVHVFKGKVELYDAGSNRAASSRKELTSGKGLRFDEAGGLRAIPSNSAAFLTARELAAHSATETRLRQRDWEAASDALRRDPHLLVYFPFQAEQPWSRNLRDEAGGRQEPRDGTIVGCAWGPGRWPGKQGLEFKRVSDRVRFHVPGTFDSITMMAWVRVDALPNRFNSLMLSDSWEAGEFHWHISNAGLIALGVQRAENKGGLNYESPVVFTPEQLGQWVHLAVVYDREDSSVRHYVDGRSLGHQLLMFDIALAVGDAELGNWNPTRPRPNPIRNLNGCMDEFMLFSRALGEQEVQQLYLQGRPRS